jgi:hypothetical protein
METFPSHVVELQTLCALRFNGYDYADDTIGVAPIKPDTF